MAATADETRVVEWVKTKLYIGGEWRDASEGATIDVEDPATGEVIAKVADATSADADAALAAADAAFKTWRNVAPRERADILRRAYDLIHERTDELALLMTMEMGKPVSESRRRSPTPTTSSAGTPRRRSGSTAASRSTRPARAAC